MECTVNRARETYFDQLERSGHAHRPEDLDRFASLGIRALRYPVLWERTAPTGPENADWSWSDARLERLQALGIQPIVGLVHHGSGPRHTNLLDPGFAEGLAAYARAVAERYPWVQSYTPVNEPLTTARFSALYGYWYPHAKDDLSWARALLNECRATVLAMRAIREVSPSAQLVQTEDLGKTHSTPLLAYQAEFENERRWLTWDLLCGRVAPGHTMWKFLQWLGVEESELRWFLENTCPPDVLGVNHYLTSERFLDERLDRYPSSTHGGNSRHSYADVEAVRASAHGLAGHQALIAEAWERYHLPIAITEVHLGCTREEQVRWLVESWESARSARRNGVDVRAITAWSLLGAYDWDSLLTESNDSYEPAVFDLRSPQPRQTALAATIRELASGRAPSHPAIAGQGWWRRRDKRLLYPAARPARPASDHPRHLPPTLRGRKARPVLITGATGTLGRAAARLCDHRGLAYRLLRRQEMDIADTKSVARALDEIQPWAVVNTAGYVRIDEAESEPERCFRENADGAAFLAAACAARGVALVTFSSDLVFDGRHTTPYRESDAVNPLNVYGQSKADAERRVLDLLPAALVVRTSAFFGPWDEHNFVTALLRALSAGRPFVAAADQIVSPTYVPDLVNATLDLLIDGERGTWHLANGGALSWTAFAERAAAIAGLDTTCLTSLPTTAMGLPAQRPRYAALGSERGVLLPPLEDALERYFRESEVQWAPGARQRQSRAEQHSARDRVA